MNGSRHKLFACASLTLNHYRQFTESHFIQEPVNLSHFRSGANEVSYVFSYRHDLYIFDQWLESNQRTSYEHFAIGKQRPLDES